VRETSNPVFARCPSSAAIRAVWQVASREPRHSTGIRRTPMPPTPTSGQAFFPAPLTIDDVVTKTGITLAVLSVAAVGLLLHGGGPNQALGDHVHLRRRVRRLCAG